MKCDARAEYCQRYKGILYDVSFLAQAGQKEGMMMLRGSVNTYHQGIRHVQR